MIFVDIETYSELDVREVGAHKYAEHPSTVILIICWAVDDGPVQTWTWRDGPECLPPRFIGERMVAHNAEFENEVMSARGLLRDCTWEDSAAMAAMCALPRGLDRVGDALGLEIRKDKRGSYLINKLSKPQRPSKTNLNTLPELRWPKDYTLLLNEFAAYCATDVEVCREVYNTLPKLPRQEQLYFEFTMMMNARGIAVDLPAVHAAEALVASVTGFRGGRLQEITGFTYKQVGELLTWVNDHMGEGGNPLESMDKATISAALRRKHLPPLVREVLEIRRDLAKSSTAKLDAILNRVCDDGRVRGSLMYHGAGTGRWSGAGIQPQNFPRTPAGYNMDDCIEAIQIGDGEWVTAVWGVEPPAFVSSVLRGMLTAHAGKVLAGADYSSIEARVVLWLAKDPGVELFASGADIYIETAKSIAHDATRALGKQAVLGCGFGMGPTKFQATCEGYGMDVDMPLAERAVAAYRSRFAKVPMLWRALEKAAIAAVKNPGRTFRTNASTTVPVSFRYDGERFLMCRLPSGRVLYYPFPELEPGRYGEQLTYMGVDSTTKAWRREHTYGGKICENVVQAIARDLMAAALLRLEAADYPVVLTVHDEAVCEIPAPATMQDVEAVEVIMCELPDWAAGLPVAAEGFIGRRYS